jgi:hypothetical protein
MKRTWLQIGGIVACIAVVAVALVFLTDHSRPAGSKTNTTGTTTYKSVSACEMLTMSDAEAVIGSAEAAETNNQVGQMMTGGIQLSNCGYAHGTENVNDILSVNLLVHAATNHTGAATNQNEFTVLKATGAKAVPGYGDAAYWDATQGQLHILSGDIWYSIGNSRGQRPGTGTLAISTAVAKRIQNKL